MTQEALRFVLDGIADIAHLNVRKAGNDDERIIAVDMKLAAGNQPGDVCYLFDPMLHPYLFEHRDGGYRVRLPHLGPLNWTHEFRGCLLTVDGVQFAGVQVKKISLEPKDGDLLALTFTVTFTPSAPEVAFLAKRVQDGVRFTIHSQPDLFDGEAASAA